MQWVIDILTNKIKNGFTGNIKVNFFRGGIANIVVEESLKPPDGCPCGDR